MRIVFFKHTNNGCILSIKYVDDIVVTSSDVEVIDALKYFLKDKFHT